MTDFVARDYSVNERNCNQAAADLHNAQWYRCPISRAELKEFMQRKDGPAIRDTIIWFGVLIAAGVGGFLTWGTWWCVPFFIVYGVIYGSSCDSRWHECGHGTAFKTQWLNQAVYQIACFMSLREPTVWRWSHTRHHTDTIIVGCDPEIASQRPPDTTGFILNLFAVQSSWTSIKKIALHTTGRLTEEEMSYIPEGERWKVFVVARIWVAIFAAVILLSVALGTILPLMYIGLPTFYGAAFIVIFGLTQHAGLAEDSLDHRLNSRTVYMNPVFRFMYWNMNYHIEHHMFPMVPYHALPALHERLKADMPRPYNGLIEAYREIIPALIRQRREPGWHIVRTVPGAPPSSAPPLSSAVPAE